MDINEIKKEEMQEIIDFYYFVKDYGHIYHDDPKLLDTPFSKIREGMDEIFKMIDDNWDK